MRQIEDGIARLARPLHDDGHASTMTAIAETLGMTLSGASSIPAVHSTHSRMAARPADESSRWSGRHQTLRRADAAASTTRSR